MGLEDEKRWLEALFATGELMVARRDGFQRVYDLAHRVLPALADMVLPEQALVHAHFVEEAVAALGISQARWIHDYFRIKPRLKDADLDVFVEQGRLLRVRVEGWTLPGYVHPAHAGMLRRGATREAGRDLYHAALTLRPPGVGPGACQRHVRLRLPHRVLYAAGKTCLWLLRFCRCCTRAG